MNKNSTGYSAGTPRLHRGYSATTPRLLRGYSAATPRLLRSIGRRARRPKNAMSDKIPEISLRLFPERWLRIGPVPVRATTYMY